MRRKTGFLKVSLEFSSGVQRGAEFSILLVCFRVYTGMLKVNLIPFKTFFKILSIYLKREGEGLYSEKKIHNFTYSSPIFTRKKTQVFPEIKE